MKLVDDLFEMYKNHLTGDEEDIFIIIYGVLEGFKGRDFNAFYDSLNDEEKFEMVALYLYEKLRLKMGAEGIGHIGNGDDQSDKLFH